MLVNSGLVLEDFLSSSLRINMVPKNASQTLSGQRLLMPVVEPVPYESQKVGISKNTIQFFKLTEQDLRLNAKENNHKFDYVSQNIQLASKIQKVRRVQQTFKKTILSKDNDQNL